jgi:hypothetical protein
MTDIEMSRRNLIATAGLGLAGAALAGCDRKGSDGSQAGLLSPKEVGSLVSEFIDERGINNYGDNPNAAPPASTGPFNPQYMVLIHMTSSGPWAINSNLAHFAFSEADKDKRIDQACKVFLNKKSKNHKRFKDEGRRPYDRAPAAPQADFADSIEFAEFNFLRQHDLYVFYEHKKDEVLFDTANNQLVTFSQFHFSGNAAMENHAFFNAEVVKPALTGDLAKHGSLIRLENHYTVKDSGGNYVKLPEGQQLAADVAQNYKMNLIYVAGSSGLPMLIDPDTGNGVGNGP